MNVPPTFGIRAAKRSTTSVDGVMGYPEENRAPAASAPSQQAWSPSRKWEPVNTPAGSACIGRLLRFGVGCVFRAGRDSFCFFFYAEAVDREVRAIHSAEITFAAFIGVDGMWRVIPLRVKCGGQLQDFRGAEFDAEPAGLTSLHHDLHGTSCHWLPRFPAVLNRNEGSG
jgi:hypothetical protein